MGDSLEYPDVLQEVRGSMNPGKLKLSNSNVIFKNVKTGIVDQYQAGDIEEAFWLIRARGYCLKILTSSGAVHRYDGFKESEYEKLSSFIESHYNCSLKKKDVSVKGWNWGVANFVGNSLEFEVNDKLAFEIPLGNVCQSRTQKNEVSLEFHMNDDASVNLMEMRFHIPQDPSKPDEDTVLDFHKNILEKADIIQATGESIAIFEEVQCLTPRGRYDIKIYQSFLQLHGKTFDYKIPHKTVLRLFLLPHKDNRQMFFVVSLDPPIKQGQTRYPFLILLFNKDEELTIELGMDEEDIKEKYEGKLTKEMSGPFYEIMSRLMKAVVNRKITVPGTFHGHSGTNAISCSYKASSGYLYPLERGFIFVHKPPVHIRFDEIKSVNFARSAGSTRSFDFDIDTNVGVVYTFSSIEKEEYSKLYDFVSGKKLRVKNIKDKGDKSSDRVADDMLDSDEDGDHDAYLEQMKREGKERDEDDDDSTDESFSPDESASSVAEEYDSNVSSSGGSDEDADSDDSAAKKRKAEKKAKKEKLKEKIAKKSKRSPGEKREKKKRSKKDPNAPKRPQSAYFLWLNEHREEIKEENPGISVTELSKKAGEKWRELTDKTEWEEKAKQAKEVYEEQMKEYRETLKNQPQSDGDDDDDKKKKKSPKSSKSPKKSTAAGSGTGYKSKEFISDESDSDSDKAARKSKKSKKEEKKKEESEAESEEKMEEGSEHEKSASDAGSDDAGSD